ncbi:MAG: M6 family metalloprotease domain-containing protein [Bacteroidaceae bacterium]|nr:M6 family metalloprotease domain-containing protein [Bacteroidaceae bacterium]
MKKFTFSLLALLFIAQAAIATPPMRRSYVRKQSNGECLVVNKHGNGHFVMYTLENGMPLLANEKGDLCYVVLQDGRAVASTTLASAKKFDANARFMTSSAEVAELLSAEATPAVEKKSRGAALNADGLGTYGSSANGSVASIGAPKIPVIMVQFPDRKFDAGTTPEKLTRLFNEKGYADEPMVKGSVKDFFESQSFGLFTPTFDIVATVEVDNGYAYYGKNPSNGIDTNRRKFVEEAIQKATAAGVDFSKYATNGGVPLVSLYYAGPGEHSSFEAGCEDYLWAHYANWSTTIGGVKFNSYFVGNEIFQNYKRDEETGEPVVISSAIDGIGVFCHEFSHALGLPDFYYTGSNSAIAERLLSMDFWSIMDYGQYAYDGYAPVAYTAYERNFLGWMKLTELTDDMKGEVTLYPADAGVDAPKAYILRSPYNTKEYYIFENRQPSTWHPGFLGAGMLVLHVDYNADEWRGNTPNNDENHQRMEYVPADNLKQSNASKTGWNDYKGDLYPGIAQNFNLTSSSLPATTLYTGGLLEKPIYDISEVEGVITFYYLEDKATTAITAPWLDGWTQQSIYDLSGRRVNTSLQKGGVYIKGGTKVIAP